LNKKIWCFSKKEKFTKKIAARVTIYSMFGFLFPSRLKKLRRAHHKKLIEATEILRTKGTVAASRLYAEAEELLIQIREIEENQ